jgi:putative ABC transport system permease protein
MFQTYLLLNNNVSPASLEKKFPGFVNKYIINNPQADGKNDIHLQPLTDIHLRSHLTGEIGTNGDIMYIYVFACVALFVLLIACFNFTNLTTAKSIARAKEVGLRKVVGAGKKQLLLQFLSETTLLALIALLWQLHLPM